MKIFTKKETLIQNITYMAIMAAVNVVFILLAVFLPYLYVLLLFILPLTSTFVILFCKKRYFIIYAIATIALCFLASMNNIGDTIFYIIPSIITGAVAGILIEKHINGAWIILFTSIIHFSLSILSLPLIKVLTGVELLDSIFHLFTLGGFIYKDYIGGPLIYFTSLAQMSITYLILKNEVKKIGIDVNITLEKHDIFYLSLYEILMFGLMVGFVFLYKELTFTFLILGILPSIILLFYELTLLHKIRCIFMIASVVIFPLIFGLLYPIIPKPFGFLLIAILFISINIPTFCRVFEKNKEIINENK